MFRLKRRRIMYTFFDANGFLYMLDKALIKSAIAFLLEILKATFCANVKLIKPRIVDLTIHNLIKLSNEPLAEPKHEGWKTTRMLIWD